tara:strand:- start:253 stop:672 length:420 start_codon:yes stop_codon:yes gene_type:complete
MDLIKDNNDCSQKGSFTCALIALAFGPLGLHKFYVGRKKDGFLHILASFFLIGFLMWPYDLFKIFTGQFSDSEGKNLKAMDFFAKGNSYQERVQSNKKQIDESPFGEWIKKNSLTDQEKKLLKTGDIKGVIKSIEDRET